jgi:hypothetical protein
MKNIMLSIFLILTLSCSSSGSVMDTIDYSKPYLEIAVKFNDDSYPTVAFNKMYPQMALWAHDKGTGYAITIFVTEKGAKNKWFNAKARPDAMPVWYGINSQKIKSINNNIDAVSGATPSGEEYKLLWQIPDSMKEKKIDMYFEANVAYDYNDYYKKDAIKSSPGYSGVNGQPSLVWKSSIEMYGCKKEYIPWIVGHGHRLGGDYLINKDISNVTTAKTLFSFMSFTYFAGNEK